MEKLKISRINGLMFVDIYLWSNTEQKYRKMSILIDTGASVTTISNYILKDLGCEISQKSTNVTTASGLINVAVQNIRKIKIGNAELSDVEVYAHEFPDECFSDGVLGMNVLEHFNLKINLDEKLIEMTGRASV